MKPPIAKKRPHEITTHDDTRRDDYYWLREKENAEVIAYLESENAYTQAMTAHTKPLEEMVYEEIIGRIQETDDSVPVQDGGYYYYSRTEEGQQYTIYCRKLGSLEAEEEIILDMNLFGAEYDYVTLGAFSISPNHRFLVYGLDITGAEFETVRVKDLETGALLEDTLEQVKGEVEWIDNQTLAYSMSDEADRPAMVYRHRIGTPQTDDVLIYHDPDGLYYVSHYVTKDKKYFFVGSFGIETHELHYLDTAEPLGALKLFQAREEGVRYIVKHRNGLFYILTNIDGAINNQLMTASVENPIRDAWKVLIPHRPNTKLSSIGLFDQHLVRHERENGLTQIRITEFTTDETHTIAFDEPVFTVSEGANPEAATTSLRFTYTSLTTPPSVFDYDMLTRERELKKRQPVLGGYDPNAYVTDRIFVSENGVKIPVSLVYRKGVWDGETPTHLHLYGYGSYGVTIDPAFKSERISLLDRGIVFAIAHIRGSQVMGRQWYENGKFLDKRNTFTDFIACAKHLIAENYTNPELMTMEGRSAGGLLMGAVLNMAPHLFKGAVAGVPFVDVLTTMLDESIPLTIGEFAEWGNPKDPEYYDYMRSYSPYDNVTTQDYPHLLVTAGLNDPRVQYWEPAKWVAKLRATKTGDQRLLLKMHMGAGHFASSGRYDHLKDVAFDYAFLIDVHGV